MGKLVECSNWDLENYEVILEDVTLDEAVEHVYDALIEDVLEEINDAETARVLVHQIDEKTYNLVPVLEGKSWHWEGSLIFIDE